MKEVILQYSIRDLIDQGPKNLSHKQVTMFDLKARFHSKYLSKDTAYKFSSLGIIHIYRGYCDITVNLEKSESKKMILWLFYQVRFLRLSNFLMILK